MDLGAGFGAHSIPLAERGYRVLAIDSCRSLIDELAKDSVNGVEARVGDIRRGKDHSPGKVDLILCMGDTLTHLDSEAEVAALLSDSFDLLGDGGRILLTSRDYASQGKEPQQQIIPVQSDESRILTCVLSHRGSEVQVSDILHTRDGTEWVMTVSTYRKLRLAPSWVREQMDKRGFEVREFAVKAGMVGIVGEKHLP